MKRYHLIFLIAFLVSIPFLGRGLFESSEGRYAMVAKSMVESGDYWMPKINGHVHLTKPPLTYWIIATGQALFGMNTFGSRIVHALIWILLCLVVMRIGELLTDKKTGTIIGLVFVTSLFPAMGTWFLTTDAILVFFQATAFWSLLEYRKNQASNWIFAFWISLALAFNTKGPVSLFPLLFWIAFYKAEIKSMIRPLPVFTFIFISVFWYLGLEIKQPGTILSLFQNEIIKRSTTDFSKRNAYWWAPIVTYVVPLMIGWGLWPFFTDKQKSQSVLKKKENQIFLYWIGFTLVVFSIIQSRLVLYILPLSIPCAILLGQMISDRNLRNALTMNLILLLAMKSACLFIPYDQNARQIADFVEKKAKSERVYFPNEELYGVEFYLGPRFVRYPYTWDLMEASQKNKSIKWIAVRDRREKLLEEYAKRFSKKIIPKSKMGKWHIVELRDI